MRIKVGAREKIPGYFSVDIDKEKNPDYVRDIQNMFGFADELIEEIVIEHVLEHICNAEVAFQEMYRILKPKGIIRIRVPHANNPDFWGTIDHKHGFIELTFKNLKRYNGYNFNFDVKKIETTYVWNRKFPFRHPNEIFVTLVKS